MLLFAHVAVAFSMVLSFGVVRLLDGLRPALVPGRRYWVHALWLVQKLLNHGFYWWGFLSFREGIDWTVASFFWMLIAPALLFLQATALATTNPSGIGSWREHFFQIRRWFFSVDIILILHSVVTASLLREIPLLHPFRALQAAGLTISILGAASASPRLHAAIAPMALVFQSLGLGSLFFRPLDFGGGG
jgi:hypothetical protein